MDPTLEKILIASVPTIITIGGGSLLAWFFNRKLESFKQDILGRVHARKILIEKEMEFYSKLFNVFTDLRDVMTEFTSPIVRHPPDETHLERQRKQFMRGVGPFNELYTITWSYRPFYPDSLNTQLDELRKLTHTRLNYYEEMLNDIIEKNRKDSSDPRLYGKVSEMSEEILKRTDLIIASVKARIDKMS